MGNRKNAKNFKKKAARAPRDPEGVTESDEAAPRRTTFQWFVLGFKVTVGLALLIAAVLTLAWGVHRYAQTTPRFAIVDIEVEGTERLSRQDVLATAGLEKGQNLFSLDTARAERLLVQSPWISSARIKRRLPGTVRLQVVERDPRAIAVIAGKNYLVSSDGTPFKELGSGDPHDFPVITGISVPALARDRRAESERVARILALLRNFEQLSLSRKYPVEEVHLSDTGSASLVIGQEGITVHLGEAPWKRKLLRAERVVEKARRAGGTPEVVFLDNSAHPERVVMRVQ